MQKGTISVQTENILPIIKKYLYSDQEIFLRELVSNAVDATQKLRTLANRGEEVGEIGDTTIQVTVNKDAGTITISDRGLGMSHDEVEKYITQVAFSGAKEFLEKYKDTTNMIGHFGLGFYSAFMVADKVEIVSKSYKTDAPAVQWVSDGGIEYEIGETDARTERGTDIILHISKDADMYLEDHKIEELLTKYCRFLPVPIQFGETNQTETIEPTEEGQEPTEVTTTVPHIINDTRPLWMRPPSDNTDADYLSFYRQMYPMGEDPLFWIHLNVDYPFNLTGVLYFPKINNKFEVKKDRIHLYCNQVFVTDHVENIVPEFLMLLHGVIDSPDIPLNVSRSYLQSDPEVKKINKYITRKVADKLEELFKNQREDFEQKWQDIGLLIKYGVLTDDKFAERADKFTLVGNTNDKYFTLSEYLEHVKPNQTDKSNRVTCLYTTNEIEQHAYVVAAQNKDYDVLKMGDPIDAHYMQHVEHKHPDVHFKRVDADTPDLLIEKDETTDSVLSDDERGKVHDLFAAAINAPAQYLELKALSPNDAPVTITKPEFMRRMKEMSRLSGGMDWYKDMPDSHQIVVNTNHAAIAKLLHANGDAQQIAKNLYDLALLQQNMLKGADLTDFINRTVGLMGK